MKSKYIVLIIGIMVSFNLMAQEPNFPEVPIDGGISILLASGIAYGAKKIFDANKNKE